MLELLEMWALVEVLGFICLPLTLTIFKNLPDRGWAFSKIVGLALLAFCVWLPLMTVQFLPFSQLFILGVLLIILALNIVGLLRVWRTLVQLVRKQLVYVLASEVIFLGMVFLLGWLRSYLPDIRSFEMFMDEGFLAAIMRSPHFPPNDMWLSGYPINYYYYAHYTIALLAKLLNQPPSIAFNTGICLFFGLTAVNIFGVTCNIVSVARAHKLRAGRQARPSTRQMAQPPSMSFAIPYGIVAMGMGLVLGNLASTQQWWQYHDTGMPFDYWFNVSRVVTNTINEFPAFSFILSCFHAHVLTLAFTILAIALIFNLFLEHADNEDEDVTGLRAFGRGWRLFLNLGFMAVVLGGLFTMNGWDLPTYLGFALVCLVFQQWMAYKSRFSFELVLDTFTVCATLTALSFFLYAPFYLNFVSPSQGIGIVDAANRSKIQQEMLIYGTFMFLFVSLLLINVLRERQPAYASQGSSPHPDADRNAGAGSGERAPTNSSGGTAIRASGALKSASGALAIVGASQQATLPSQTIMEEESPETDSSPDYTVTDLSIMDGSVPESQKMEQTRRAAMFRGRRPPWLTLPLIAQFLLIGFALLIFVALKNSLWFVISGCIAVLGFELALYHLHDRARAFTLLLGTLAFTLIAMTEIVYLRDVFAQFYPRMNTVFKFYFQAWALLAITSGTGLYFIVEAFRESTPLAGLHLWTRRFGKAAWSLIFILLLLAGMIYPIVGSYQRYDQFAQRTNSLDGMTYLKYYSPGDYYAIRWLNDHVQGDPVIVEAFAPQGGGDYSDYDRISAFTGLPTIVGWAGHEYQWRVNWLNRDLNAADFYRRGGDVNTIYTSTDPQTVLTLMARYQAQYLYVGNLEVTTYPNSNLTRFAQFMQIVYSAHGVTIYKVPN